MANRSRPASQLTLNLVVSYEIGWISWARDLRYKPSPWAEGDFEEKIATLLVWANVLNRSVPAFTDAQRLLEGEESVIGRVIRRAKHRQTGEVPPKAPHLR